MLQLNTNVSRKILEKTAMKAYLVINHFLNSKKFSEMHDHLIMAAATAGIDMKIKTNLSLSLEETICDDVDFVLFWDKDVRLARRLECEGIKVFNSSRSIELCDDKAKTYIELSSIVPQPKTFISPMVYKKENMDEFIDVASTKLHFPLVFKECFGSFGQQVYLCNNKEDINLHITEKPFILQKYIESSSGHDRRLEVVGGKVIAAVERFNEYDFRSNVTNGGVMTSYTPSSQEEEIAIKACNKLGLLFAGVDILTDGSICEVNSNAHIINLLNATGIDAAPYIFKEIKARI